MGASLIGILANVSYVAKKSGEIEQKMLDLEKDIIADKAVRQGLEGKIDGLDRRVYGLDAKISGLEVKVDLLKESLNELKKLMMDRLSSN